jgi:hypothetical protein
MILDLKALTIREKVLVKDFSKEDFQIEIFNILGEVTKKNLIHYCYAYSLRDNQQYVINRALLKYIKKDMDFIKTYVPERDDLCYQVGQRLSPYYPSFWPKEWNRVFRKSQVSERRINPHAIPGATPVSTEPIMIEMKGKWVPLSEVIQSNQYKK